jgi:tripartite-type tricarboxylate transporter receptor subunit TctC
MGTHRICIGRWCLVTAGSILLDTKEVRVPSIAIHISRRNWNGAAALTLAVGIASAQDPFPTRPVTLVVPFVAGGGTDTGARMIAQKLALKWGHNVVMDNRGGAGGVIGADLVARAKPDGYTLLMGNVGTQAINPSLYAKLPYDPEKAFAPVSQVAELPLVLVAYPQFKSLDVKGIVALGRAEPDAYSYASSGVGNSTHLAMEVFQAASGARLRHVAYKGGGQANTDACPAMTRRACQTRSSAPGWACLRQRARRAPSSSGFRQTFARWSRCRTPATQ